MKSYSILVSSKNLLQNDNNLLLFYNEVSSERVK